ncbi:MAG: acyltransferase [Anaerolineales bacterium]|uniref:acyltransferase family protein n=1 Tax=Candidatus Villigracilis vicinus TaxID=3140679 RepID=UPI00313608A3|nr:acyltransferase [Anaerolineales bacterium]MBK9779217.1 acyltransferase [Anaerolineales bacterium]
MIPGLDGLRALAILTVLGSHTKNYDFGWMGVQFFFVLSGFLITGILLRMKENLPGQRYFKTFYGRRFLRIFPLYYFYLFLLGLAAWQTDMIPFKFIQKEIETIVQPQLPYAFLYVYNFLHASAGYQHTAFLSHLWSLSVEEQFYIVWPLILFFTPKERTKAVFLTAIVLGPILRVVTFLIYNSNAFPALLNSPYLAVYVLPFSHIDAFAFGAFVSQFSLPKPRTQLAVLAVVIPLLGFATQYIALGEIRPDTLGYEFTLSSAYKFIWGYSLLNYFFALLVHAVHRTGLWVRFLDLPIMQYLGKISYGMYVYHYIVIWFIIQVQNKNREVLDLSINYGMARTYLLAFAVTALVASVSFRYLEKPINDLKDRLFPLTQK